MNERPLWPRMTLAALALAGALNATYLTLHRSLPQAAPLQCGLIGNCQAVQDSAYSVFPPGGGVPVAYIGLAGFVALLALCVAGLSRDWLGRLFLPTLVLGLATGGLAFSAYLTAIEAFVLHQWCQWCILSAILAALFWGLALLDWRRARRDASQRQPGTASRRPGAPIGS